MDKQDYEMLKQSIHQEYQKNLDALERVWRLSQAALTSHIQPADSEKSSHLTISNGQIAFAGKGGWQAEQPSESISMLAKEAISQFSGTFTINDVSRYLQKHHGIEPNTNSLASAFHRFVKQELLEVIEQGQGRRPSTYKRGTEST